LSLLNRKGLLAQAIHDELVQILGSDAVTYSRVTSYLGPSRWRTQNEEQHSTLLAMCLPRIVNTLPLFIICTLCSMIINSIIIQVGKNTILSMADEGIDL
jgi:amino acid permease